MHCGSPACRRWLAPDPVQADLLMAFNRRRPVELFGPLSSDALFERGGIAAAGRKPASVRRMIVLLHRSPRNDQSSATSQARASQFRHHDGTAGKRVVLVGPWQPIILRAAGAPAVSQYWPRSAALRRPLGPWLAGRRSRSHDCRHRRGLAHWHRARHDRRATFQRAKAWEGGASSRGSVLGSGGRGRP
jgi:hypothetical protein